MFRNLFDGPHLLIVLLVILVLFGGKKLPDAARGLGRSLRIFKSEVKEMKNDGKEDVKTSPTDSAKDSEPTALEAKLAAEQAEADAAQHRQTRAS